MKSDIVFSKNSDEWQTPLGLYTFLNKYFHFELDPCTTADNPLKTRAFYTKEDDGLKWHWYDYATFINPPYSQISKWVDRSIEVFNYRLMNHSKVNPIVLLVPSRTDTKWFHKVIGFSFSKIVFLKGRLKFWGSENSAPFPSCLIIFSKDLPEFLDHLDFASYKLNLKEVL